MDNEKSFAIKLADNDKSIRDKSLRNLRNYMKNKAQNSEGFLFISSTTIKYYVK